MPDPTPDVAAIARGLTPFDAGVLIRMSNDWAHSMPCAQRTRARNRLVKKGLAEASRFSGLAAWRRSDLGRAVAAYLAEGEAR